MRRQVELQDRSADRRCSSNRSCRQPQDTQAIDAPFKPSCPIRARDQLPPSGTGTEASTGQGDLHSRTMRRAARRDTGRQPPHVRVSALDHEHGALSRLPAPRPGWTHAMSAVRRQTALCVARVQSWFDGLGPEYRGASPPAADAACEGRDAGTVISGRRPSFGRPTRVDVQFLRYLTAYYTTKETSLFVAGPCR